MHIKPDYGLAVKMYRTSCRLTQAELAEQLHVTASYVCMIEANNRRPSLAFVSRIAERFAVPLSHFVKYAEDLGAR
jgi:transcriptional regulator with XRE-family HTH domain